MNIRRSLSILILAILMASLFTILLEAGGIAIIEPKGSYYVLKENLVDAVVGNPEGKDFDTKFTLNRWGGECSLHVSYDKSGITSSHQDFSDNKVKWTNPQFEFHYYLVNKNTEYLEVNKEIYEFEQNVGGGFEFEIILKEKPLDNIFVFDIELKNLEYYYQPPLANITWEDSNGDGLADTFRPLNVVGSYAFYHKNRKSIHRSNEEADKYMNYKMLQLYRPYLIDSNNITEYGEVIIENNKMYIILPEEYLNNAIYPVNVDPRFGYETGGSSGSGLYDTIRGSVFTCPESGTGLSISAYIWSTGNDGLVKFASYKHSDITVNGSTTEATLSVGTQWYTENFTVNPSLTNQDYILVAWGNDGDGSLRYDAGDTNQGHWRSRVYNGFPSPTAFGHENKEYSIYCTYSVTPYNVSHGILESIPINIDDNENFRLNLTVSINDATSITNYDNSTLRIDPTNLNIIIRYKNNTDTFSEVSDPNNYIVLDLINSVKIDMSEQSVRISFRLYISEMITKSGWFNVSALSYESLYDELDNDTYVNVFNLNIRVPTNAPEKLFGGGFNHTVPYIEIRWVHDGILTTDYEIQNSSNGITFTYLAITANKYYIDNSTELNNGTYRYYKVRARRETGEGYKNTTFSNINFDRVYFIMTNGGVGGIDDSYASLFVIGFTLGIILIYGASKR